MDAAAALVLSPGALRAAELLDRAAELRRRPVPRGEDIPRPPPARESAPADDGILLGELLPGPGGEAGAATDGDRRLPGTPTLRNALTNGGLVDARHAVQSYETQREAGYVQQLRQSTLVDLYV